MNQRRGPPLQRIALVLEQRGDKEWMRNQLDRTNLAVIVPAGHPQIALLQFASKIVGNPIITVVSLLNAIATVSARDKRIGAQLNIIRLFNQRAA